MKRLLFTLLPAISLVFVGGCAGVVADAGADVLAQVSDTATGTLQTIPSIIEVDGKPAMLYATKDNRIAFQMGTQRQLLDETARVRGGNHVQLHLNDKQLHALWWSHQDGKNVYHTASVDGGLHFNPVTMVNDEHGVLPPYTLTTGPKGILGVTYQDERNPSYQAYFNRSVDFGRTWPRPDQRLDTPPTEGRSSQVHEPQSVESGAAWLSVWTDSAPVAGQQSYRIISRRSDDAGFSWSPAEVLYSSDHHISSLKVRAQGSNIVVAADELNAGIFAVTSQDQGRSWQRAGTVTGTDRVSNSGIDMTLSNGRAHLVWMKNGADEKAQIMRASLDIGPSKWLGAAQRLDLKSHNNTQSISPEVLATSRGTVVATWVDYRDIRPNIYLAASKDQGQSWSAPQPLLAPGEVSAGWPKLIPWRDEVAIGYEVYPSERVLDGKFVLRLLHVASDEKGLPGMARPFQITEEDRKARLEQRVKALWEARIAGEYERAYDMFDFAYKAATPKSYYMTSIGVITYLTYAVDKLEVSGNEASVNMKLRYEVKPTMVPGSAKPITVLPIDVDTPTKWVWVGRDWYLVYTPSFEPPTLKY
jgi:hypothetical protein